jgi:hypothetical protein
MKLQTMWIVALLMASCEFGDPGPRGEVGVKLADNMIEAKVRACEEALVSTVALTRATGRAGKEGDVLWEIKSGGSSIDRFRIGTAPEGFVEVTPLTELAPNGQYVARVTLVSRNLSLLTAFSPDDLSHTQ